MIPSQFRASLKTGEGRLLEYGYARADSQNQAVEFFGEFVPLLRMGDTAHIVRLLEGREAHIFTGQVYISSPSLLRLVNVTDQVLSPELELPVETQIQAKVQPVGEQPRARRRPFAKNDGNHIPKGELDAIIYTVSPDALTFRCEHNLPIGQRLSITTQQDPKLQETEVEVTQIMAFGIGGAGHKCEIVRLPKDERERLLAHIKQVNTLFSAVGDGD